MPNFVKASVDNIPFPDKHFGAAFCSHVLEHVPDWKAAARELDRVADKVFIIVPKPIWMQTWLHPKHKRLFFTDHVLEWAEGRPHIEVYTYQLPAS